jgi:hypothetical protein
VYEDFVLINKKTKMIRSYSNHEGADGMMNITTSRKFKLAEPEKIEGKIHNMVASQNTQSMLLFDDKNIYVISTEDGTILVKPGMNIQSL